MQILAQTEYQDLYRVTDGVLLVVNKFLPMQIEGESYPIVYHANKSNSRIYNKNCQKELKILIKDYKHEFVVKWTLPTGTVLYNSRPVIATDNKFDWIYEVKTTGNALSGDFDVIDRLLSSILYTIRTNEVRK